MENCIRQNNAVDIYEDYYADLSVDRSSEPPTAKTINIFRFCTEFLLIYNDGIIFTEVVVSNNSMLPESH